MKRSILVFVPVLLLLGCVDPMRQDHLDPTRGDDVFAWNAAVPPNRHGVPFPLTASIHFEIPFRFEASSDGRPRYVSPDFVDGQPTDDIFPEGLSCFLWRNADGPVSRTAPISVTGSDSWNDVYSDWTGAVAFLDLADNPQGIDSIQCHKRAEGQLRDLAITFEEIRAAFWNPSTGAYVILEEAPAGE